MKKIILLIAIAFFSLSLYAAPASKESIEQLVAEQKGEIFEAELTEKFRSMMGPFIIYMEEKKQGKGLPEEEKKIIEKISETIAPSIVAKLMPIMKEKSISLYAENFSQAEIEYMIAYYCSPMGKTIAKKTVAIESTLAKEIDKITENIDPAEFLKMLMKE